MKLRLIRSFIKDESGQSVLEFLLLMLAMISIVTLLKTSTSRLTIRIWSAFAKKIAAACPSCDAGTDFNL